MTLYTFIGFINPKHLPRDWKGWLGSFMSFGIAIGVGAALGLVPALICLGVFLAVFLCIVDRQS